VDTDECAARHSDRSAYGVPYKRAACYLLTAGCGGLSIGLALGAIAGRSGTDAATVCVIAACVLATFAGSFWLAAGTYAD
jgi:hypothetical protein